MACSVEGTKITLTRGDTLKLQVRIMSNGEEYTPKNGDIVRFAVKSPGLTSDKSEYVDTKPKILKEIPINTMVLQLDPQDTKRLGFGTYVYDIQITFADGTVDTFITNGVFRLTEEVE